MVIDVNIKKLIEFLADIIRYIILKEIEML